MTRTLTITHVLWAMYGVVPAGAVQRPHRHQSVALDLIIDAPDGCYTLVGRTLDAAGEIVEHHYVHLGIAAATPRGLVVPNIKDAQDLSLIELAEAIQQLTETARLGRTQPAEMQQGTITITNFGVFGMDFGTPILNRDEVAILAMGSIKQKPWVVEGQVLPRYVTTVGGSFDHRVVDGDVVSKFVADVASVLEEPALLLD